MLRMIRRAAFGAALLAGAVGLSHAAILNGSGQVSGWGFEPFNNINAFGNWGNGAPPNASGAGAIQSGSTSIRSWAEGNNAAPIDYNSGNFEPSPGGANGEKFDHEFLGWRILNGGSQIEVIAISSLSPNAGTTYNGRTWHMGDVFINVDGAATGYKGYDFALTAGQWTSVNNDPLHPNDNGVNPIISPYSHMMDIGLYKINNVNDVHGASSPFGTGGEPGVPAVVDPVTVRNGAAQVTTAVGYETQMVNYGNVFGANEDGTWLYRWVLDTSWLGPNWNPYAATFHLAQECGNDFLNAGPLSPDVPDEPPVPEPATLGLIGLGLASYGALRRRKKV